MSDGGTAVVQQPGQGADTGCGHEVQADGGGAAVVCQPASFVEEGDERK